MRVERQSDGTFEIQISKYNKAVWVLGREAALQLARWIIELAGDEPVQSEVCTWEYWAHGEYWETGCDNAFVLGDGTPKDNGMVFCPYCGQRIEEVEG